MAAPTVASTTPLAAGQLRGSEKRKDIQDILNVLEADLEKTSLERNEILERLRVYTTSRDNLDPILTKRGVSILCRYGFDDTSRTPGRIALRCLCNSLLQAEPTRQIFVDGDYPKEATKLMENGHPDDEFLSARLLLLCTYRTNLDFDPLFEKHRIAEIINTNISHQAKLSTSTAGESLQSASTVSACSESLKLLYNLTARYPHHTPLFSDSLLPILKMLNNVTIPSPPLQPPVSLLINCLVHLDLGDKDTRNLAQDHMIPQFDSDINLDRLAHILDLATRAYTDKDIDQHCSPLIQVLLRIAEIAPPGPKAHLRRLLLPSNQDRERVLGKGNSLSARLLRLSSAPMTLHLRELIPALLFELSDKDAKLFVQNVGYGFAAGFLLSKGVQLPPGALEAWGTGDIDDNNVNRNSGGNETEETEIGNINPITGQRRDMEPKLNIPEMTDEEKEREAERLFVLFERLRATGIVNVENPVAQAVHGGRFEEVD
jgi:hypothetical protein